MFKYDSGRYCIVYNNGTTTIPANSIAAIVENDSSVVTKGYASYLGQPTIELTVAQATADNQRPIVVTGPFDIQADGWGVAFLRGPAVVRTDYIALPDKLEPGDSLGAAASSYLPLRGGRGLVVIGPAHGDSTPTPAHCHYYYVDYQDVLSYEAANLTAGGGVISAGNAVKPAVPYSLAGQNLTAELTYISADGRIQANFAGVYQFGFSLTAEGPSDNKGSLMTFGLYNLTDTAYTGHYAAAENLWDTTYTTDVNAHRANIACTGLVNAAAGDVFDVRNAAAFDITVTHFNFWMARHG